MTRNLVIKLIRHGESEANTEEADPRIVGDFRINLTEKGRQQALAAGVALGADFIRQSVIYRSPYLRVVHTLDLALEGAGLNAETDKLRILEDPLLREIDIGYSDLKAQLPLRRVHGWFYYRFEGGESPADCCNRVSIFLDPMMREVKRRKAKKVLIASHGMSIRCFVMRFLHLTVDQFMQMENPDNCDIITIAPINMLKNPVFVNGSWGVEGIKLRLP